jgi:adenine-specific DNA methylase
MAETKSFIEVQFPVSKLSKESYKERKAGDSQTLASLGKWHGRKPLVLVRALILGLLLPATEDPKRDREIFLKLMTMDDEGMWRRCKGLSAREVNRYLSPSERDEAIVERDNGQLTWNKELSQVKRKHYEKRAFLRMGYDERLTHCLRPEEIDGPDEAAWNAINAYLSTSAASLPELVRELGEKRFGHVPRIGDAFAGGGSIPFEAARLGCEAFASDLNPTSALQNYGALQIIGGSPETMEKVKAAQREVYQAVRQQVAEWGIERNEFGWEADVYLYCNEVLDPITGWRVPMLPTLAVDPDRGVIAELVPNSAAKTIQIRIRTGASAAEVAAAKLEKTADDGVVCPFDAEGNWIDKAHRQRTSSKSLRGQNGLRLWNAYEWKPRPEDVYQERLYCIRWTLPDFERLLAVEQILCADIRAEYDGWNRHTVGPAVNALVELLPEADAVVIAGTRAQDWSLNAWEFLCSQDVYTAMLPDAEWGNLDVKRAAGEVNKARRRLPEGIQSALAMAKALPRRHYAAPNQDDLAREARCEELLSERFEDWQNEGYLPNAPIEPGKAIRDIIRNRGWSFWLHLFTPRQLLIAGLYNQSARVCSQDTDSFIGTLYSLNKLLHTNCRLCGWEPGNAQTHRALPGVQRPTPLISYAGRSLTSMKDVITFTPKSHPTYGKYKLHLADCAVIDDTCDIWITDPGYGDMAQYAEYSEFYLAWMAKSISRIWPNWYTDSKRALAVELAGDEFAMVLRRCYANLATHMEADGLQIVMFTQQDVQVWSDLTLLLWASGLQVVQSWTIQTETTTGGKDGDNTVQGTVCMVLRKRIDGERGDLSEIRPEVQMEVREQLQTMIALDDRESPNFSDSDYQLAAYAAALRIITGYESIREIDVMRELARGGRPDPNGIVRGVIDQALREATDFLVPDGLERAVWKGCTPEERLYLKGVEIEAHGERRNGVYQEFARGLGVREYRDLLQSDAANETRLRTPSELKGRDLETGPMGGTVLRRVLYAIYQTTSEGMDPMPAVAWLRSKYPGMAFFDVRQSIVRLMRYLATKPSGERTPHWKTDAEAAYLLAARLENEN